MKIKILVVLFLILISVLNVYSDINDSSVFEFDKGRQTKSYPEGMAAAEAYYDAALKGELQTEKKEPFLLSSLKRVGKKPSGRTEGGIYEDANGGIWIVKQGQDAIKEYLGSKVMDLLIGPFSPEVKVFVDAPGYTASKLLIGFLTEREVTNDSQHKPIVGEEKLLIAMDLMGLSDRNAGNMGYIDMGDRLEAARVDFDHSFKYDVLKPTLYEDLKALDSIIEIPDEMFLYVLGEAYNDLWEAGITINYREYKDLGSTLIARKISLNEPEFEALYEKAKNDPSLFTIEDYERLSKLVLVLYNKPLLIWAIENDKIDPFNLFLDKGADVNAKDYWGNTPLIWAAKNNNLALVILLLDKGADVNAQNKQGRTALDVVELTEIAKLLKEKMQTQAH